ncbi:organic hydroperoxide resistance protein, partial [Rhizobiaceae sp. 2RAB30]
MAALYSTTAHVTGGRNGKGRTEDGLLDVALAMPKELGGAGGATNPEQLFAVGYAACFESAVRFVARKQKLPLQDASVTSTVQLLPNGEGFRLGVALEAETKGLDQAAAEALVATAHQVCPYSIAIRGTVD